MKRVFRGGADNVHEGKTLNSEGVDLLFLGGFELGVVVWGLDLGLLLATCVPMILPTSL